MGYCYLVFLYIFIRERMFMIGVEVAGSKGAFLDMEERRARACRRRACTCVARAGMNAICCGCRCAGVIDSLMWGACGWVLYTATSGAQWHAGLSARMGEVSEGRALICFSAAGEDSCPVSIIRFGS